MASRSRRLARGDLVYRGVHCTVHFDLDRDGIRKLAVSEQMGGASRDWIVNKAIPFAKGISPRSSKDDKKHYQDSFEIEKVFVGMPPSDLIIGKPFPMMRAAHRMLNTAPYAVAVEYGDKRTRRRQRAHRVFGRVMARFNRPYVDPF